MYAQSNASISTLVPVDRQRTEEKEKETKYRTHLFSRPKKHKDKAEDHTLTLSSASSNSKPVDPNAPQSIYSFAPSSPGPSQGTFGKTGGLDLRHAGRKRKDEKLMPPPDGKRPDFDFGLPSAGSQSYMVNTPFGYESTTAAMQDFGISNMSLDDAWDFLKAKFLIIFEGEELRTPVEDLNRLVSIHIQRCVQKSAPMVMIEDLRDLLEIGFVSLEQTLRGVPEERVVPRLVDMWLFVFGTLLPYMQAVFLPLDLELRGHGIMTPQASAEFWGLSPESADCIASELDVRRIVLLSFRDNCILSRHDVLKRVFSRLSLESINVGLESPLPMPHFPRPGTAGSVDRIDPGLSSFNSQGSTLLNEATRSRATSNTSAPELPTFSPTMATKPAQPDSSQVTETVGRVLQCMSVLVSVQSDDNAQATMEDLTKTLKLNWLGRGRTGRNRKGLVGARAPRKVNQVMA